MTELPYPKPINALSTKKMRANRRADTKPEMQIRSLLHRQGLRFRKDYLIRLPSGRNVHADIAFTKSRIAVFIDGCFWHSCPVHGTIPKSNKDYWHPKLMSNVKRDKAINCELRNANWKVIRLWTHVPPEKAVNTIIEAVHHSRSCHSHSSISLIKRDNRPASS